MRQVSASALFAVGLSACAGAPSSTFESGDDGWTLSNNGASSKPTLVQHEGNPAGNVCGKDADPDDIWYFVAPGEFLGDVSASYGKRLTFDLKQGESYSQIRGRDVILNGGGLALTVNFRMPPGRDWTPYAFQVSDQGGWTIDDQTGRGTPATETDLRMVLGALTSLRIRGEFFDGREGTACLDNVYFGRK